MLKMNSKPSQVAEPFATPEIPSSNPFARLMSTFSTTLPAQIDMKLKLQAELENYLSEPPTGNLVSIGSFWNDFVNIVRYPNLRNLVKKYCSLPASSVESERLFSTARIILTDLRNRLSPENLRKLLLLHHTILLNDFNLY